LDAFKHQGAPFMCGTLCKDSNFIFINARRRAKKSRSGVLCDCEGDFMAAAQGGVDAVVELHEEDVAVLYAAWD